MRRLLAFAVLLGIACATAPSSETRCNPKSCSKKAANNEKNICGSDGLTYPSRCSFEKARCQNRTMTISKRGSCLQQRPCNEWEAYRQANPGYKFEANCKPDGTYGSAQCHPAAGYCWCVTPQGVPLPYTTDPWKPGSKQHCGRKKSTRRRSPARKRRNRACKLPDKAKFNNHLINIFHTEWSRDRGELHVPQRPHTNDTDFAVNVWKFGTMDANGDGFLDKTEYRDMKRVVKKAVRPKRCAKTFPKSCDVNSDQMISQQEWVECITRDGMDDGDVEPSSTNDSGAADDLEDYTDTLPSHRPLPHALNGQNYEEDSSEIRDDDPTDCLSDRQAALMDGGQFYVPDCTPDGRYQKVQCYKAAGYCFCVHEDSGKNIPGTSMKNGLPTCDQLSSINRPMKGCPDEKKSAFFKDLIQFLYTRMPEVNGSKALDELLWNSSREERVATWTFVVLDKNKNKMLDRNEWKAFKEMVSTVKTLRKCGRKLPRYCDINKDRHISMTEWLGCLNVQQGTHSSVTTSIPNASSRAGKKNPLSMLMED